MESLIFGVIASSALVIGALVGGRFTIPKRALAAMLAFAAGALITALTFELFEESYQQGGIWRAALGLAAGAVVFTLLSQQLDRLAEGKHPQPQGSEKLDLDAAATENHPPLPPSADPPDWRYWPRSPSTECRRTLPSVCPSAKGQAG